MNRNWVLLICNVCTLKNVCVVNFVGHDMSLMLSLVKAINRQLWMVVNFFLTVVGIFVFGYYAAYFAGFSSTGVRKSIYYMFL